MCGINEVTPAQACGQLARIALVAQGQVQGVGFRPFVWRIAHAAGIAGFVQNTSAGARIEAQGSPIALAQFERALRAELPPLARITALSREELAPLPETTFEIRQSEGHAGQNVLVSADVAVCSDCLADIRDPGNRRFGYAFTNCTNCGPRFSITRAIPYDRPCTTMACFPLCAACAAEYGNPANRRFHAQPIACPACGPKLWYVEKAVPGAPTAENMRQALARAGQKLLNGGIVAIRGLGGFQLACDAANDAAIATLRKRKNRPRKALAVMLRDLAAARHFCLVDAQQEQWLTGARKPIVLCQPRTYCGLSPLLAPDIATLGIMLPYTPLHALLLDWLHEHSPQEPALVMTSANPGGEPICLGNREAMQRLDQLADAWLLHNRDILCRVDDSVVDAHGPIILRRARGFAPEPVPLDAEYAPVLGAGAQLKATFCLTRGNNAFLSQHIGDLDSPACIGFYEEALAHMQNLLEVAPKAIAHDLHPDYMSTRFAKKLASDLRIPAFPFQHHAAHAAACLAENGMQGPALALCLDGSGLGPGGVIWGGELLYMDLAKPEWRHLGGLASFPLPGGEAAIRQPWRVAQALAQKAGLPPLRNDIPARAVTEMLARNVNCPPTSSAGRLFDAVASALELCHEISYEGQAAMLLQRQAELSPENEPDFGEITSSCADSLWRLDSAAIFARVCDLKKANLPIATLARAFHQGLARAFAQLAHTAARQLGLTQVALTGGVLQNALFAKMLRQQLRARGLTPISHHLVPPGDGGLALGQAVWAAKLLVRN